MYIRKTKGDTALRIKKKNVYAYIPMHLHCSGDGTTSSERWANQRKKKKKRGGFFFLYFFFHVLSSFSYQMISAPVEPHKQIRQKKEKRKKRESEFFVKKEYNTVEKKKKEEEEMFRFLFFSQMTPIHVETH